MSTESAQQQQSSLDDLLARSWASRAALSRNATVEGKAEEALHGGNNNSNAANPADPALTQNQPSASSGSSSPPPPPPPPGSAPATSQIQGSRPAASGATPVITSATTTVPMETTAQQRAAAINGTLGAAAAAGGESRYSSPPPQQQQQSHDNNERLGSGSPQLVSTTEQLPRGGGNNNNSVVSSAVTSPTSMRQALIDQQIHIARSAPTVNYVPVTSALVDVSQSPIIPTSRGYREFFHQAATEGGISLLGGSSPAATTTTTTTTTTTATPDRGSRLNRSNNVVGQEDPVVSVIRARQQQHQHLLGAGGSGGSVSRSVSTAQNNHQHNSTSFTHHGQHFNPQERYLSAVSAGGNRTHHHHHHLHPEELERELQQQQQEEQEHQEEELEREREIQQHNNRTVQTIVNEELVFLHQAYGDPTLSVVTHWLLLHQNLALELLARHWMLLIDATRSTARHDRALASAAMLQLKGSQEMNALLRKELLEERMKPKASAAPESTSNGATAAATGATHGLNTSGTGTPLSRSAATTPLRGERGAGGGSRQATPPRGGATAAALALAPNVSTTPMAIGADGRRALLASPPVSVTGAPGLATNRSGNVLNTTTPLGQGVVLPHASQHVPLVWSSSVIQGVPANATNMGAVSGNRRGNNSPNVRGSARRPEWRND